MTDYFLKNIDSEEIEDILVKIETSFDIKFDDNELVYISNFGQLCDHIADKIQLDNADDCTTQQAFYKLRDAISATLQIDKKIISTDFLLADLFPRKNRLSSTKKMENKLGFKLNILRPPYWVSGTFAILLISSFIVLFFNWQIGLVGLMFSIAGQIIAVKIGKELDFQTVGQLAEKMTRENYLKSRCNSKTINKKEIEEVLRDLFSNDFGLDRSKLTREAYLNHS